MTLYGCLSEFAYRVCPCFFLACVFAQEGKENFIFLQKVESKYIIVFMHLHMSELLTLKTYFAV